MTLVAAAVAKLMVLVLVAVFSDRTMDTQSFIGPSDIDECYAAAQTVSNEWKTQQPSIVAILPDCHEVNDPLVLYDSYMKAHPHIPTQPQSAPLTRHVPGNGEA